MKSPQSPATEETLSPNLIPMIDIMFLLLLFFMLGADMGQRELAELKVPEAQTALPDAPEAPRDWTTINVFHQPSLRCSAYGGPSVCRDRSHWTWSVRGHEADTVEALAALVKAAGRMPAAGDPGARKVLIRADAQAPYGLAQQAIQICAQLGLTRLEVSASRPRARKDP